MIKALLQKFISTHWDQRSPLLLALSGGTDSRLLFELLHELQNEMHFRLDIAHVDHGWRSASSHEADSLESLALKKKHSFHRKTLDPALLKGNLEAVCRLERQQFFRELCKEHGYQAVFLGHHADDQAETVLKRILEGASLSRLAALQPVTLINELILWRPLLNIPKKDLNEELQRRGITAFDDETNRDSRFLRGRMRTSLLPFLDQTFGKSTRSNLQLLSQDAQELKVYLDEKVSNYMESIISGPFGSLLNLKENFPQAPIEQKHLIQLFCLKTCLSISRQALQKAHFFLNKGAANKFLSCGQGFLYIDRYRLFSLKTFNLETLADQNFDQATRQPTSWPLQGQIFTANNLIKLTPGLHSFGPWQILVGQEKYSKGDYQSTHETNWQTAWQGTAQAHLPLSNTDYFLGMPQCENQQRHLSSLNKKWNNAKVPSVMRHLLPVILQNDCVVHEFLTGKQKEPLTDKWTTVKITFNPEKTEEIP